MEFSIDGILLIPLLIGLVEFAKSVGLDGDKPIRLFTFAVGAVLFALYKALPLLPPDAATIAGIAVWAIAGPLAAMGLYDLSKAYRPNIGS